MELAKNHLLEHLASIIIYLNFSLVTMQEKKAFELQHVKTNNMTCGPNEDSGASLCIHPV